MAPPPRKAQPRRSFTNIWRQILVLVGLLAVSVTVFDTVWQWKKSEKGSSQFETQALFKLAAQLYRQNTELKQFELDVAVEEASSTAISIVIDDAEGLHLEGSEYSNTSIQIIAIEGKNYYYQFNPAENIHIRIGPIPESAFAVGQVESRSEQYLPVIGFYLLLACIIGLWLSPILKGLDQLRSAMFQFSKNTSQVPVIKKQVEPVASMVESFLTMANTLHELFDVQQHLTRGLSHEIRTPLARIKFSLAALAQRNAYNQKITRDQNTHISEHLDSISSDINEIEELTRAMLEYSRLHQPEHIDFHETINAAQFLAHVARHGRAQTLGSSGVQIKTEVAPGAVFKANETLLQLALSNLVENAKRFANSRVVITYQQKGSLQVFRVEDDGPGLPDDAFAQALQPFSRIQHPRASRGVDFSGDALGNAEHRGFGLGLSTVKKIMELHGGDVELSRAIKGSGLIVQLRWPVSAHQDN